MVTRTSEALQPASRPVFGEVAQASLSNVAPGSSTVVGDGGQEATERLVSGLFRDVTQLAGQGFQVATQEAYLAGQAKAGQIESEEALESHPMTRDWTVAGYRDATGRLKIADAQVKLAEDMKWLRQGSPEDMNKYLAERRKGLEPMFAGMSREARASAFASLLLEDRSAVATHTSEHVKYIQEVTMKGFAGKAAAAAASMQRAIQSNDVNVLDNVNKQGIAMIYEVMADTRLSSPQKLEFVEGFTKGRLAEGNVKFYAALRDVAVPVSLGGAETRSLLSLLPEKEQEALSKANWEAEEKYSKLANAALIEEHAGYMNQREVGTYSLTYEDAVVFGRKMMTHGAIQWSAEQYDSWLQGHLKHGATKKNESLWADMYLRGDIEGILRTGGTEGQAKKAFLASDAVKNSTSAGIMNFLHVAGENGMSTGRKAAGELANTAMTNILNPDGQVNAQHMEVLTQLNALTDGYTKNPHMQNELLSGMDASARDDFLYLRSLRATGASAESAMSKLFDRRKLLAGYSTQQRAALVGEREKDNIKWMQETIAGKDNFDRIYQGLKFWQPNSTALGANQTWFSNEANNTLVMARNQESVAGALITSMNRLSLAHPLARTEDLRSMVEAEVLARTVVTPHSPIIVPDGMTPQTFFGVQESQEQIGKAIYKMHPAKTPGGRMVFSVRDNDLLWQEYNAKGEATKFKGVVNAKTVQAGLRAIEDEAVSKFDAAEGAGVVRTDPVSKDRVWFNGRNTASIAEADMLQFREDMVKFEGIRLKAYDDVTGKPVPPGQQPKGNITIGVGANMKYAFGDLPPAQRPSEIDEKQAGRIFKANTDTAAVAAKKVMAVYRLKGQEAFRLVADFAFKSGSKGLQTMPEYKTFFESRDAATAMTNLRLTPAYKSSGKDRQAHYEQLLTSMMKGM